METTIPIWTRGQSPPADLASGKYVLTFVGNYWMALGASAVLRAALGRTVSYPGGHSLTVTRADLVRTANDTAILSVVCQLVGFPWALLLAAVIVVGGGLFTFLSLQSVRKVLEISPAGGSLMILGGVAIVAVIGFALWKWKGKT